MNDTMTIEVLQDGTIKTTTDVVSPANHQSAEAVLKGITDLAGGSVERQRRGVGHTHTHQHGHEHAGHSH